MKNSKTNFENLIDKAYENVRMASWAIDCLIERIDSPKLEELVRKQNEFYLDGVKEIRNLAKSRNIELEDVSMMNKGMSYISIKMKTISDNDASKISEMLVQGTTMGITDMIKSKRDYPVDNEELSSIVDRIISHEEEFVDSLKTFL